MFIVGPIAVVVAVCATVIFMREMPRLFALLIVRIADRLSAARHTQIVEALNGRKVPATWTAASEDRKLLHAAMRSTMRVTTFRSLYPLNR
ncbi:hypothetical protein EAO27_19605 [Sphingopyxis sp. YF1]|jgi:hypothetical protein|uniref:hypothetical protein n=1 Tax=unclassified Sphingopyxis TaxID=2614943 RepID=UPI001F601C10|nr:MULTISPECIES: hypothetical protein [unclassified Sphingopyxis]UNU44670.1 hypothetical protein EAO27_19605 [Sphingopyxis sp. YF1]USI76586.1 hypothetical protein KEC45_17810 [Sphingopyxis sp. USTB-05]